MSAFVARHRSAVRRLVPGLAAAAALCAAARGEPPHPSDQKIESTAAEVLSRPEFTRQSEDMSSWLFEQLLRFFEWLGTLHSSSPSLFWLILVGGIVVLVLLLAHIGYTVYSVFTVRERTREGGSARQELQRQSAAFRQQAQLEAQQGNYTEAIRCLFLSLVYRFDESGRVLFQRAFTNREYLALFADRPTIRGRLLVFVDMIDERWYAQRPSELTHYEKCLGLYEQVTGEA